MWGRGRTRELTQTAVRCSFRCGVRNASERLPPAQVRSRQGGDSGRVARCRTSSTHQLPASKLVSVVSAGGFSAASRPWSKAASTATAKATCQQAQLGVRSATYPTCLPPLTLLESQPASPTYGLPCRESVRPGAFQSPTAQCTAKRAPPSQACPPHFGTKSPAASGQKSHASAGLRQRGGVCSSAIPFSAPCWSEISAQQSRGSHGLISFLGDPSS